MFLCVVNLVLSQWCCLSHWCLKAVQHTLTPCNFRQTGSWRVFAGGVMVQHACTTSAVLGVLSSYCLYCFILFNPIIVSFAWKNVTNTSMKSFCTTTLKHIGIWVNTIKLWRGIWFCRKSVPRLWDIGLNLALSCDWPFEETNKYLLFCHTHYYCCKKYYFTMWSKKYFIWNLLLLKLKP